MSTTLHFNFDSYNDFDKFLNKHSDVINMMSGDRETDMTQQLRQSVSVKEQLPEFFKFQDNQLGAMVQRDAQGMKKLMDDNRVTVEKEGGEGGD